MSRLILEHVKVTWEGKVGNYTRFVSYKMTFWLGLPCWLLKVPIIDILVFNCTFHFNGYDICGSVVPDTDLRVLRTRHFFLFIQCYCNTDLTFYFTTLIIVLHYGDDPIRSERQ